MAGRVKKWLLVLKICAVLALLAVLGAWAPYFDKEILEMPADYSYSADVISYDNLYDTQSQQYSGRTQSKTTFSYKTVRTEGAINIIQALFDVRTQDGEPIFSVKREYGISHEDYTHAKGYGDKNRDGYLFGPAGYDKSNFMYWHINYDQPLKMVFQDEENILGLNTYHYKSDFKADQTKNLTQLPDVGKAKGINLDGEIDLWIEPYTGSLIKYEDEAIAYYYDLVTGERLSPWNQFSNQYSFNSVSEHVALAEKKRTRVFIVSEIIPAILLVLIASLTAWCAVDAKKIWQLRANSRVMAVNSAVIMACVIVIFAWLIRDSTDLITLFGTSSETHPSTAIFILLICLCNLFFALKKTPLREQSMAAHAVLAAIVIVSAVNIVCNLAGVNFVLTSGAAPVSAAVSFGIILLALLAMVSYDNRISHRHVRLHELLIVLLFILGVVSIIGSAYEFGYADSSSWYRSVSVSTAVLLMLLAASGWDSRFLPREQTPFTKMKSAKPLAIALLIILVGTAGTGPAWNSSKESVTRNATLRFENDTNRIEDLITQRLNSYVNALQGTSSLFGTADNISRSDWRAYVDGLQLSENYPGDQGIGYAVIVPSSQKQALERQIRAEGYPNFSITPAEPERDSYTPIIYIEPFDARNKPAFGFDISADPTRQAAMQLARDTGETAMSGKVTLLTETTADQQVGFVLYKAVYRKDTVNNNAKQRQSDIQGYVLSPISVESFMRAAVGDQSSGVGILIYDTAEASLADGSNLLFSSNPGLDFGKADLNKTIQITTGGRIWTVQYANLPGYISKSSRNTPTYVLVSGLSISLLLGIAFFGLASSRQRAQRLAHKMTGDLEKEKNKAVHLQQKDEAILSSIGEGLILYSPHGIIERVNAAALRMLGHDEDEVVGKRFIDVLKAADSNKKSISQNRRPSVLAVQKNIALNTKLVYERKDGSIFPVEITVAPIMAHGRTIGAIEVFRDITQEEALDQAKTDFISLASHQLRTPLTTNKWYLEMLLSGDAGKLRPSQSEFVQKINTSNEHLIELVVSLLNVTRIESGRLSINPKLTDFHKLISSVVDSVQPKLKSKKQTITIEVQPLPKISLDENMIRQVVLNLLTNAIKYSPEKTKIAIKAEQNGSYVQCEVKDEGYGIPPDQQKDMFSKFFRAKNTSEKEPEGNGLGLYLVKQIVGASGGKIWFDSAQNKGTSFYFTLPLKGMHAKKGEVALEQRGNQ